MGHDVFVSYSTRDKAVADAVCAALEGNGVRCWIAPRDIKPGENWATAILRGIADSRMMVLIFSSHTNSSPHIRREVERAVHHAIAIAPLRIEDVMPENDLEFFLSSSHWMDALTPPMEAHLREFAGKVRGLLAVASETASSSPNLSPNEDRRGLALAAKDVPPARRLRVGMVIAILLVVAVAIAAAIFRSEFGRRLSRMTHTESGQEHELAAMKDPPSVDDVHDTHFTNTLGMKFVRIEPGEFDMGSPTTEAGRFEGETRHHVRITRPFMMAIHHVTRGQFAAFVNLTGYKTEAEKEGSALAFDGAKFIEVAGNSWRQPGFEQTDDHPVVDVSWNDAVAFCQWLSQKEKRRYGLPTEAQWEYACRAGARTAYYWGDNPDAGRGCANCADLTAKDKFPDWNPIFNWRDGYVFTSPVGSFEPNKLGLYDMIGNVWQWCGDYNGPYPERDSVDPRGPADGDAEASRVLRGGAWIGNFRDCRCANRGASAPGYRGSAQGFRVCLDF